MQDPIEQNILGVQSLVGSQINKTPGKIPGTDDVSEERKDALSLKMTDEELILLDKKWTNTYRSYEAAIELRQKANKTYYLGRQQEGGAKAIIEGQPVSANLLFEAEETFLPAALSKNPEPVVYADNTPEGTKLSSDVKTMLQYHADALVLRRKLTLVVRHWSIYFLGVMKHGWDEEIKDITSEVVDPRKLILDPEAAIDSYGDYTGEYLGERKTCTAEKLAEEYPDAKAYIIIQVDGKMGTNITYTEWWTPEYCFYVFKGKVLDKNKNPHFKEDEETEEPDLDGVMTKNVKKGVNHFAKSKIPYTFLSVFSLGEQPHDITSLIEQNIPNQRRVTKRTEQLDYNLSRANNSDVFSQNNFNQETAKQASQALAKGNPVLVPSGGPIGDAIHRLQAPSIGADFFKELENSKLDLRSIFGTQGITSQPPNKDTTARGMILQQQFDNTRIGGGIGDALEQFADNVFNWWVQLYYVYYDQEHFGAILGGTKAVEYITLQSQNLDRRLVVSVSPDSMKPKDELTQMNQAMTLWDKGAIDPKTLLTMLDFPDPQTTAESTILWLMDKSAYLQMNFPELAQKLAVLSQGQVPGGAPGATPTPGGPVPPAVPLSEPNPSAPPASPALSNVPIQ